MLHHASLEITVAQADAEVAFWALLDYAEILAPTTGKDARSRWLRDALDPRPGAGHLHLVFEDEPTIPPRGHVAVVRAAHDSALTRLRAAGFEVAEREPFWESPRAFVRSPAGHRIEVIAFAPRA